jgi:signal peptidase II
VTIAGTIACDRVTKHVAATALPGAPGRSFWPDRVVRGSVVDFLNVGFGPLRTGIFNVADMAIMLGLAICVCSTAMSARTNGT